ncbi:MAG: aminoacyl-tRNA hydrolase [Deltaproteobacteria bacterium]|nr:aminoacyl-tRNA hydrolase [Deltaproteobacteria bacterium]
MSEREDRWLLVGLGNPGARYSSTRHNIGFMVIDALADVTDEAKNHLPNTWKRSSRFKGELLSATLSRHPVLFLQPETYMNLSGESVAPLAHFYRIPVDRILTVHDDVDLELGRLKIKRGGGDGGHRGIRSMAQHLGDPEFIRVRFGVGRPPHPEQEVADFVLSDFHGDEIETVEKAIGRAVKAVRVVMSRGLTEAMNRYNKSPKTKKAPKPPKETATPTTEDSGNSGNSGDSGDTR